MDDDDDVQDLRDIKRLRVEAIRRARAALGAVEFQLRPDGDGNEFAVEKYTDRLEAAAREFLRDIGRHQEAAAESAERPCKPCKPSKPSKPKAATAPLFPGESSAHARASKSASSSAKRPPINNRRPGKEPIN